MYDLQLQDLTLFLGVRPIALGTMSVWEALQDSALDNEHRSSTIASLQLSVSSLTAKIESFCPQTRFFWIMLSNGDSLLQYTRRLQRQCSPSSSLCWSLPHSSGNTLLTLDPWEEKESQEISLSPGFVGWKILVRQRIRSGLHGELMPLNHLPGL
jgi:hypothetical protein